MNVLQLFSYIEVALQPANGGKFAILEEKGKTTLSIFTYKKEAQIFGPVFIFEKIKTETDKFDYNCLVQSDLSGIKYKLGFQIEERLFDDILAGLHGLDQHYMKDLEALINEVEISSPAEVAPTPETQSETETPASNE